ncbi:MAG: aldo/keto reductase [Flavobacteriales bacterium]|jgi:aryl-alcohol dehydrogenase-like predicted oxidoreductase|nr:aldo/keto reductase [Flavobacteriales bacterium]
MPHHAIAHTDLRVSRINLGGNVFGWTLDEERSFAVLDAFVAAGFNFIDTADSYPWWVNGTGGTSEAIIGKWMKARGNRDRLVIATKVGSETKAHPKDISAGHIMRSAEASLQRLGTDRIDLYYTHFDDGTTPVEETLGAYARLIAQGKVRYIGASNLEPDRLERSMELARRAGLPRYVALQPRYNLMDRTRYETDHAPLAERHELSVFPYYALASGFLTGKYRSAADLGKSPRGGGVAKYLEGRGPAVLHALDAVAAKHGSTPATVALAWLLHRPGIGAPIVSATSAGQVQALAAAPALRLDAEDMRLLDVR